MMSTAAPVIDLQFQLTPQDYARANWVHFRSAGVVWFVLLVPGLLGLSGGLYSLIVEHELTFPLFLGLFATVFIPLSLVFSPRAAFKKQPALAAPQTFQAGDDG